MAYYYCLMYRAINARSSLYLDIIGNAEDKFLKKDILNMHSILYTLEYYIIVCAYEAIDFLWSH